MSFDLIEPTTDKLPERVVPTKRPLLVGVTLHFATEKLYRQPMRWFRSWKKVWLICRKHREFGTIWYYDGVHPGPFTNYPNMAIRFRKSEATKLAAVLQLNSPDHEFSIVDAKTIKPH